MSSSINYEASYIRKQVQVITGRELELNRDMVHLCCGKQKVKRGLWSPEEDEKLIKYITKHGHGSWSSVPKLAGNY